MRAYQWTFAIALAGVVTIGCGSEGRDRQDIDLSAELAVVEEARAAYDEAWQRLQDLEAEQKELKGKSRLTADERARLSELEEELEEAKAAHDEAFSADDDALTGFLNEALNAAPDDPATLRGLRLYADKAMRNANTFMTVSGDYRRAIEILETAASYFEAVDAPAPEDLKEAIARAKYLRFLSKERFDQVARRMTKEEVKAITGTPFFPNIREHESGGRKIVTWFFNRADGEVAAIHFTNGRVYQTVWQVERQR